MLAPFALCLLGIVLAHTAVHALIALSPPGLPRIGSIELNGSALLNALVGEARRRPPRAAVVGAEKVHGYRLTGGVDLRA